MYRFTYTIVQYNVNNDNLTPPEVITTPQAKIYYTALQLKVQLQSHYSSSIIAIQLVRFRQEARPRAAECLELQPLLALELRGHSTRGAHSVTLCNGRGVAGRVAEGAIQPEDVAGPGRAASCRKTSRLMLSVGLLSKGRAKRATESPIHLVRGAGAVGDSK